MPFPAATAEEIRSFLYKAI